MPILTLSTTAMATRFELLLYGEDESYLRAAGEEAFDEIDRLESQLSLYRSDSELSFINSRAAHDTVRVEPRLFNLLQTCLRLYEQTDGAFDITVAPLMRCWGFTGDAGAEPSSVEIEAALQLTGMGHVALDERSLTVRFDREGVTLDLGAIGKGYAIQRAADILREVGVTSALIHGGTSSAYAVGSPPDGDDWKVAIRTPGEVQKALAVVGLRDESQSVSASRGKSFTLGAAEFGHVIDPRTGYPSQNAVLTAVVCPHAAEGDALSTALLVLGPDWLPKLVDVGKGMKGLVVARAGEKLSVSKLGIE